jgi:hypothetical protein
LIPKITEDSQHTRALLEGLRQTIQDNVFYKRNKALWEALAYVYAILEDMFTHDRRNGG